jgi:hypothetical protein
MPDSRDSAMGTTDLKPLTSKISLTMSNIHFETSSCVIDNTTS